MSVFKGIGKETKGGREERWGWGEIRMGPGSKGNCPIVFFDLESSEDADF